MTMGDIPDGASTAPIPAENIVGMGVAGPPAEQPEEEVEETTQEGTVQRESVEYSEEGVGRNVDVEA
jgi:hypothetical protein